MNDLAVWWFAALAFFWVGYVVLDGFDLGVGVHMRTLARNETERRTLLNTIGPVWDGNEVWLVTAGAATFAAFPLWYAALFSGLYIPLTLALLALIARAVSIEYRGKLDSDTWRSVWTTVMAVSSGLVAFLVGALLASTSFGLPINANGDRVGGPFEWLTWPAVLGGVALLGFCLVHGLAFIGLKADGPVRHRARRALVVAAGPGLAPLAVWAVLAQLRSGPLWGWLLIAAALCGVALTIGGALTGREGRAFVGMVLFVIAGFAAVFVALFPAVLPSTIDPAFDLTVANASVSEYTLKVMTVVAGFGVPVLLVYQGWTYWVFRKRVLPETIPVAHDVASLPQRINRRPSPDAGSTRR